MSLFYIPRIVRMRLEQIQRDFLCGCGALECKPHLVKWVFVCLDKRNDGLGVKSISILNKTFLCKWSWCFMNEKGCFLESRYLWEVWTRKKGGCILKR